MLRRKCTRIILNCCCNWLVPSTPQTTYLDLGRSKASWQYVSVSFLVCMKRITDCSVIQVRIGGVIVMDNVLWHGRVADPLVNLHSKLFQDSHNLLTWKEKESEPVCFLNEQINDSKTESIRSFNRNLMGDGRVSISMVRPRALSCQMELSTRRVHSFFYVLAFANVESRFLLVMAWPFVEGYHSCLSMRRVHPPEFDHDSFVENAVLGSNQMLGWFCSVWIGYYRTHCVYNSDEIGKDNLLLFRRPSFVRRILGSVTKQGK